MIPATAAGRNFGRCEGVMRDVVSGASVAVDLCGQRTPEPIRSVAMTVVINNGNMGLPLLYWSRSVASHFRLLGGDGALGRLHLRGRGEAYAPRAAAGTTNCVQHRV